MKLSQMSWEIKFSLTNISQPLILVVMGEMPRENPTVKNISFGIEGILLGLFFFVLVLFFLNYFRIISLSFLYSKLSVLPQKEQIAEMDISTASKAITTSNDTLTVEEKAEKAGYKIAWKGPTEDGSGRAILASEERQYEGLHDLFGWTYENEQNLENSDFLKGMFLFKSWENIPDSSDYYAIMADPISRTESIVRVLVEKSDLSSAVYNKLTESDSFGGNRTRLEVEDLYYGHLNLEVKNIEKIGLFSELNENMISKIIKPGDVIAVFTIPTLSREVNQNKFQIRRDKNNYPVIISFIIRRFNGKNGLGLN